MAKIVVMDGQVTTLGHIGWEELGKYGDFTFYDRTPKEEIVSRAHDADIVITNKVPFRADTLSQLPRLKMIAVFATGYNIIDCEAARQHGVAVCNVPAYSTMSVAQMTFAHILNIFNRVERYADMNRHGRWSGSPDFCYWDTPLQELCGKTIGIVGLGNIGMQVAHIALSFGLRVVAHTSKREEELPQGVKKVALRQLFATADIISLHCPLTVSTRGMINSDSIGEMKTGAVVINTSRGPLVDESDMAAALRSGKLHAYGADVMAKEPPAADNPLLSCPNAFITPHIAWATEEARSRLVAVTFDNIRCFLNGSPQNVVN